MCVQNVRAPYALVGINRTENRPARRSKRRRCRTDQRRGSTISWESDCRRFSIATYSLRVRLGPLSYVSKIISNRRTPHNGGHAVSPRRVQASYTGTKPPRDRRALRAFRNDRTSLNDHLAYPRRDCDEHNGGSQLRPAARETAVTDVSKKLVHTHDPAAKTAAVCEGSSEYDSRGRLNRSDVSAPRGDSASADRSPGCRVAVDVDRAPMRTDSPRRETAVRTRLTFLCV